MTKRTAIHSRRIELDSFLREDGLWDLETRLVDTKGYDYTRKDSTLQKAGAPVHDLTAVVTVTEEGVIESASVNYEAAPYSVCSSIESAYRALTGMHLLRNFHGQLKEQFSRTRGCTHMTELLSNLPTLFVQSIGSRRNARHGSQGKRPFMIDGCHAYSRSSEIVKSYYPQWFKPLKPS